MKTEENDPELEELVKLVECIICRSIPAAPIFNCINGHFICNKCSEKLSSKKCVYCRSDMTNLRNLPLEAILSAKIFKCDFSKHGCKQGVMTISEYESHVKRCPKKMVLAKIRLEFLATTKPNGMSASIFKKS